MLIVYEKPPVDKTSQYDCFLKFSEEHPIYQDHLYDILDGLKKCDVWENHNYRITEVAEVLEAYKPFQVTCDYNLPEKLTIEKIKQHPEFLKHLEKLGDEYDAEHAGVRLVYADYVAHISFYPKTEALYIRSDVEGVKYRSVNEQLYLAAQDGEVNCFRKYYTHGKEVLTTWTRKEYLKNLHAWEAKYGLTRALAKSHFPYTARPIMFEGFQIGTRCRFSGETRFPE